MHEDRLRESEISPHDRFLLPRYIGICIGDEYAHVVEIQAITEHLQKRIIWCESNLTNVMD